MTELLDGCRRALILAPHTDDAELGCGGTMSRLLRDGAELFVAVWSVCQDSLPAGSEPTLLKNEFLDSMRRFGIAEGNVSVFDYPVRRLSDYRQEVLEQLVKFRRDIDPAVVFLPSGSDLHQDHRVLFDEGVRAFKERSVLGYELPWNHICFPAQAFVRLTPEDVKTKWEALSAYKSQLELKRSYFCWDFINGLARMRGVMVKAEYAEAFEVVRLRW